MAKIRRESILSKFKLTESYNSLILGAIAVVIVGVLFFSFARGNRSMQTSSVNNEQTMEQNLKEENSKTSSAYTIKPGDDLWSISENVYNDGHKWIEIAKINKLENPGLIHVGNKLTIPKIEKEKVIAQVNRSVRESSSTLVNNAINGTTYTIRKGDNLWDISVRAYGDGFKWVEIARVNKLENPDLIYPDNVLKILR